MTGNQPLGGKRVLITRARHQAGQLSAELARLGAEAVEIPTIEILPPISFGRIDAALRHLRDFDWLVVTSVNAVRAIRERVQVLRLELSSFGHLKIAAVGAMTARALAEGGLMATVTPDDYVAESLIDAIGDKAKSFRVLIVRAAIARDVIPDELRKRGAQVEIVEAYRTTIPQSSVAKITEVFTAGPPDAVTFTSSSTVANFFQLLREAGYETRPEGMLAISIGPVTSQTLREHGWSPAAEAVPHDIAGLVMATVKALR